MTLSDSRPRPVPTANSREKSSFVVKFMLVAGAYPWRPSCYSELLLDVFLHVKCDDCLHEKEKMIDDKNLTNI